MSAMPIRILTLLCLAAAVTCDRPMRKVSKHTQHAIRSDEKITTDRKHEDIREDSFVEIRGGPKLTGDVFSLILTNFTVAEWNAFFARVDGFAGVGDTVVGNRDGSLTKEEWEAAGADEDTFYLIDADHSGTITKKEWEDTFMAIDANGGGTVDRGEWNKWRKTAGGFFSVMDLSLDGKVSEKEWNDFFASVDGVGDVGGVVGVRDDSLTKAEWKIAGAQWEVAGVAEDIFDLIDKDHSGTISKKEWEDTFNAIDKDLSKSIDRGEWNEWSKTTGGVFALMDTSHDGKVSEKEWNDFFTKVDMPGAIGDRDASLTMKEWKVAGADEQIFDLFDADHSGTISHDEWAKAFKAIDKPDPVSGLRSGEIDRKEWDEWVFFALVDTSHDGKVSQKEWDDFFTKADTTGANGDSEASLTREKWKAVGASDYIFDFIDTDQSGTITKTEWDAAFHATVKDDLSKSEWDAWVATRR